MSAYDIESLTPEKEDPLCKKIGDYIANGLNSRYTTSRVVQTVKTYNCYPIPAMCPLLKVYRQVDAYRRGTIISDSNASIEYILSYPEQERLPGITAWVSKQLNALLLEYNKEHRSCSHPTDGSFRIEHRTMVSEIGQPIYAFVRCNLTLIDT